MEIQAKTLNGELATIETSEIALLKASIHGEVISPEDSGYDAARHLWNGMIDRHPALIIRCSGTADVIKAVRFARDRQLLISVRGAGHNIAGRALENDVLHIDLSLLRYVHVDPENSTITVSPGATLADLDQEAQTFGLALPMGINSTTGIAGLTLGGGFGWLSRKFGMTVDSLISVEVITAEGERIVCSQDEHPDLFWAIRGGGGNFGIATSFTFRLHKVGPSVLSGPIVYSVENGGEVLRNYRAFCQNAPDEATVWAVIRHCPPFPFVDAAYHGKLVIIIVGIYVGEIEDGGKVLSTLKKLGTPLGDHLVEQPFVDFQKAFDPLLTPGYRNYWKTHNFLELSDGLLDALVTAAGTYPTPHTEIFIGQMGGLTNRISRDATAYPHRDVNFIMNLHTRWERPEDDGACISWARALFEQLKPFATGGSYINFVSEGDDNLGSAYADNIQKLVEVKKQYDPNNVFRSNLNITP